SLAPAPTPIGPGSRPGHPRVRTRANVVNDGLTMTARSSAVRPLPDADRSPAMTVAPLGPAGPQAASAVERALRSAASATGAPFAYLLETARRESAFDPEAQARTSSATGLFQFIESTWLAVVKEHGAAHGLATAAASITRGADGVYRV